MEVSAPELKPLHKMQLRYTISPFIDNPLQMGIRTRSGQHLKPGPGVCLWEDEETKHYLISKCSQMAQGFFHICSSQGEEIKSCFHGCQRSGGVVLPMDEGGMSSHPGATTAAFQNFNRKDSCFSSEHFLLSSPTSMWCSMNEFSVCCECKKWQLYCREGDVGVSWCGEYTGVCMLNTVLILSEYEKVRTWPAWAVL